MVPQSIEPEIAKNHYFFYRIEAEKNSGLLLGVIYIAVTFVLRTFLVEQDHVELQNPAPVL